MILAVDAGNTRIKWGLHDGGRWLEKGWVATADAVYLREKWSRFGVPDGIIISNVAGKTARAQLIEACSAWPVEIRWVAATGEQCGVHNAYENPAQLGSDRWASLIAARGLALQGCVVVNAGTALTADALSAEGRFLGGLIVPGLATMQSALAESTASVAVEDGRFQPFPCNTADAVYSGAIVALAGAVEHMIRELRAAQQVDPVCLLSGGDAELLAPLLSAKARLVDNLVLEGLIRIVTA